MLPAMTNYEDVLADLEKEHAELRFQSFSSETALSLGLSLVDRAKREKKAIVIDISLGGHQLFHYSFAGTSPDNDAWAKRKSNTASRFWKSSYYIAVLLEQRKLTLEERYGLSTSEYAVSGGSFPIFIKDTGAVGTITVSGLKLNEDHLWVVEAIRDHL